MKLAAFVTAATLALAGAVTFAQNVTFDFDKAADFTAYRRYAWVQGTRVADRLVDRRIVSAIDRELAGKGLVKAAPSEGRPDLFVAYHASFDRDLQVNGFGTGWGGFGFGGSRSGVARAEEILVGTIVVDVVDAATRNIVWRGMATQDVDVNARPDKRDKNIDKTAEKIFRNYPPK